MADQEQYRPHDVQHYPNNMVVAVVPPAQVDTLINELAAAGVASASIDVAQGVAGAQRIVDETERGIQGRIRKLFASNEERVQRDEYVQALRSGRAVIRVLLEDANQKDSIGRMMAAHGGKFINYYGRLTMESLS